MTNETNVDNTQQIPAVPEPPEPPVRRALNQAKAYCRTLSNDILLLLSEHPYINLLCFLIGEFFIILLPILPQLLFQLILFTMLFITPWIILLIKEYFHRDFDISRLILPFMSFVHGFLIGFCLMLIAINLY